MSDFYDPLHDGPAAAEGTAPTAALNPRAYQMLAWDIETCPLPDERLTPAKRERVGKLMASAKKSGGAWDRIQATAKERGSDADEDLRQFVMATHPMLNWICCISMAKVLHPTRVAKLRDKGHLVAEDEDGLVIATQSYAAERLFEEISLLERLWSHVGRQPPSTWWVTFNGKGFDCPTLLARTMARGFVPPKSGILNTHRWRSDQHLDLMHVIPGRSAYGLADLCEHVGLASPKEGEVKADGVAQAVAEGRIAQVVEYCEKDTCQTLRAGIRCLPFID